MNVAYLQPSVPNTIDQDSTKFSELQSTKSILIHFC